MKTYEFRFRDGQRLVGEGNEPAEALLDAYHRNGFLPITNIIQRIILVDDDQPPPDPPEDIDPGIDISTGKPPKRKGKG